MTGELWGVPSFVRAEYELRSQKASSSEVYSMHASNTFDAARTYMGWPDFFQLGPITTTAPLAPFMVDGQLQLDAVVHRVDGVACEVGPESSDSRSDSDNDSERDRDSGSDSSSDSDS